ncbi:MAG: class I SAM-dependent methyltransferase [Microscillaceae bacterium]|jgi:SAM-dependent methyltransferase|nr:class I SAM-dependent methyltransferase [Microscillaceae bacterium]
MIDNFEYPIQVYNTNSAKLVLPLVIDLLSPKSVLDVGCGIGTWLKVFQDYGIEDVTGIDGEYAKPNLLINQEKFMAWDLGQPLQLNRQFDLVVSLEVAEHLPESVADTFVHNLIKHGTIILFSAAIPGQGGSGHINEQWASYWHKKFKEYDYEFYDLIRPLVWNNENIGIWYRQNIFIVAHSSTYIAQEHKPAKILDLVHPQLLTRVLHATQRAQELENGKAGVKTAFGSFTKAIGTYFKKLFTALQIMFL